MSGTSSGTRVRQGEVAMVYSWWLLLAGERLYVPGYGAANIEDVGSGWPAGNHYWVDLGYNDNDWVEWAEWVTVYFLTPVPANVADTYIMP
jgi:3D (Asp-Asp-Asp) domain-containing protein